MSKASTLVLALTFNVLYFPFYRTFALDTTLWKKAIAGVDLSGGIFKDELLINARVAQARLKVNEGGHLDKGRIDGESKAPVWRQGFSAIKTKVREYFRG